LSNLPVEEPNTHFRGAGAVMLDILEAKVELGLKDIYSARMQSALDIGEVKIERGMEQIREVGIQVAAPDLRDPVTVVEGTTGLGRTVLNFCGHWDLGREWVNERGKDGMSNKLKCRTCSLLKMHLNDQKQ
jgi:hypothetical protein